MPNAACDRRLSSSLSRYSCIHSWNAINTSEDALGCVAAAIGPIGVVVMIVVDVIEGVVDPELRPSLQYTIPH